MQLDDSKLLNYVLQLADNSMILGQRNAEWCGHGPVLEQDIALTNIALDLIGEARSLYQYSAEIKQGSETEDSFAFLRDELKYRNILLVEYQNTNWAYTVARQFFYDTFHFYLLQFLSKSKDGRIAEIATKTIKETTYHLKWSSEWVIRLGDGTEESSLKIQEAVDNLWAYTGEMFIASESDEEMKKQEIGPDLELIKDLWMEKVKLIFEEAKIKLPESDFMQKGGKKGYHTEQLGFLLAEMQYLQRAYPNSEW
jgi:ring-1,2-phenylacetyl-CoA epoxidase subunit PaaC